MLLNLAFALVDESGQVEQEEAREVLTRCLSLAPQNKDARKLWAEQVETRGWPAVPEGVSGTEQMTSKLKPLREEL